MTTSTSQDTISSTHWSHWVMIAAGTAIAIAAVFNSTPLQSANDTSRWCTVRAIVDEGTYQIDNVISDREWDTIDKVRHEGNFYSTKPALLPTLVAGVYYAVQQVTGWTLAKNTNDVAHIILTIVNVIPMMLAWIVLSRLVTRYAVSPWTQWLVLATGIFGTFLTTFLVTLNNHTIASASLIFALYFTLRIVADAQVKCRYFAAAGFFAAFTCTNELPAALFGAWLFFYLGSYSWKSTLRVFVPSALIPLAAFFATTYESSGGWKPFYMYYGTDKYEFEHEGIPSYWVSPGGLDRSVDAPGVYLLHCTIGHHGVLSLSPIFALSILGVFSMNGVSVRLTGVVRAGALLTLAVLAFYMTRTANYNYGGNTSGLRWMFWLIPFWLICMIPALDRWGKGCIAKVIASACLMVSIYSAFSAVGNPWRQPWLFSAMQRLGYLQQYQSSHPELERVYRSWIPSLPDPEATDDGDGPWVEFAGLDGEGKEIRLRITRLPNTTLRTNVDGDIDDWGVGALEVRWLKNGEWLSPQTFHVHPAMFNAGNKPSDFMAWPVDNLPTRTERHVAESFFRGIPKDRPYNPGPFRYLNTPLRTDAFECRLLPTRVDYDGGLGKMSCRTEIWVTPEVPFGVVKMAQIVSDADRQIVSRQELRIVAASRFTSKAVEENRSYREAGTLSVTD